MQLHNHLNEPMHISNINTELELLTHLHPSVFEPYEIYKANIN